MKKIAIIAALTMAAPAAMASQARVQALANSRQLVDMQTAFDRPYQFMALSNTATFEWGTNTQTATLDTTGAKPVLDVGSKHAEGGFLIKTDDAAYGAYVGRRSESFSAALSAGYLAGIWGAPGNEAPLEQNPLNVYYASKFNDWTWGVTLKYSNGKDEANDSKATSAGFAAGITNGTWEIELVQGLTGKAEVGQAEVESKGMTQVAAGYKFNPAMEVYAKYQMLKAEGKSATIASEDVIDLQGYELGFVNSAVKTDDVNFFYGVAYRNQVSKFNNRLPPVPGGSVANVKDETSVLPVWLGVEANANSWLVMRGSIGQNVILNNSKRTVSSAVPAPALNNTTENNLDSIFMNAGLGFKLGKGMLDASFGTANAGHLSFSDGTTDKFLSNVAYTYNF